MIPRSVAMYSLFTRFLITRDALSCSMNRISGGFHPPTVLEETRLQLLEINQIYEHMLKIKDAHKDEMVSDLPRLK